MHEHVLDAHFSLASITTQAGIPKRDVLRKMQEVWHGSLAKAKGGETGGPGDHGIPEIGTEERALFEALTEPQKEAYRNLRAIIEREGFTTSFDPWTVDEAIDAWKRASLMGVSAQPMRAYLVGQMLGSEQLRNSVQGPLKPLDFRNIQYLQSYTFNEISDAFEGLKSTLRRRLIEGMQLGYNPKKVARVIENELHDYQTNWELIAITETSRAESQGRLQEFTDEGIRYAIGSTAHDTRVCQKCKDLIENKVVPVEDTVGKSNYGRKQADWLAVIPLHPRCRCVWLPFIPGETSATLDVPADFAHHT